jgi:hypothetical protein
MFPPLKNFIPGYSMSSIYIVNDLSKYTWYYKNELGGRACFRKAISQKEFHYVQQCLDIYGLYLLITDIFT